MASAVWGSAPWWGPPPPAPARPLTDIDFCSGAQLQELTQLIQELGVQESWSDAPKPGPDLLRAKDFVFSLLGKSLSPPPAARSLQPRPTPPRLWAMPSRTRLLP